jgi:hypothetical protein
MARPVPKNEWARWAIDTAERGLRAFASAYVSVVGADYLNESFDVGTVATFKVALGTMFVSAMFSLAGKARGAPDSASLLPAHADPPVDPVPSKP